MAPTWLYWVTRGFDMYTAAAAPYLSFMTDSNKATLRTEARRHRARMDIRDEDPQAAAQLFYEKIKPQYGQSIAAYWPAGSEFDSRPLIERLIADGYICGLPVTQKDSLELAFAQWDENVELKQGPHGSMEPVAGKNTNFLIPDIVIVPLLAFDRRGYRLGQGGGHYDATLAKLRLGKKKIIAVGLAYAQQACLFNLPVEPHDQKLDWVITPQAAHDFS